MAEVLDPRSVARRNAQSLLEAIAAAASSERKDLIEREIGSKGDRFDLTVVDQYSHNVLFYALNYGCDSRIIAPLRLLQSRNNATKLLGDIAAAGSAERSSIIERAVAANKGEFDLTVEDTYHHNVLFYAKNYSCSSATICALSPETSDSVLFERFEKILHSLEECERTRDQSTARSLFGEITGLFSEATPTQRAKLILAGILQVEDHEDRNHILTVGIQLSGGNVDLGVTDQYGHNVLFYARNYECPAEIISLLTTPSASSSASKLKL